MAIETELKLHIAPEHLRRLKRHPFLRSLAAEPARTRKLYSIYYDTPDLKLYRQASALRLRRVGKRWIQTLKGGGKLHAGLHQRNEWEAAVPSEQLDFEVLKESGGRLPHGVRHHLQPVFVTDFTRNIRLVRFEGAEIELCMDSGEIRAGKQKHTISEIELELKSGDPRQLFHFALALLDIVPLRIEHINKAQYGYRLFAETHATVSKVRLPLLQVEQSVESALQTLIGASLAHVQDNIAGVMPGAEEEYLHQVRVGLRRLRVLLSLARRYRDEAALAEIQAGIARYCVELGRSREWDVFVTQTLEPLCKQTPEQEGLQRLLKAAQQSRQKQHVKTCVLLTQTELQRLWLQLGSWLYGLQGDDASPSAKAFSADILKKRLARAVKTGEGMSWDDTEAIHRLRIACKKLRYSIEMFGALHAAGTHKREMEVLSCLQESLGELNDLTVAQRCLDELDNRARHAAVERVRAVLARRLEKRIAAARKIWKAFTQAARS